MLYCFHDKYLNSPIAQGPYDPKLISPWFSYEAIKMSKQWRMFERKFVRFVSQFDVKISQIVMKYKNCYGKCRVTRKYAQVIKQKRI